MLGAALLLLLPIAFLAGSAWLLARWLLRPKHSQRRAVFVMATDPDARGRAATKAKRLAAAQATRALSAKAAAEAAAAAAAAGMLCEREGSVIKAVRPGDAAQLEDSALAAAAAANAAAQKGGGGGACDADSDALGDVDSAREHSETSSAAAAPAAALPDVAAEQQPGRCRRLAAAARALCGARPYRGDWIALHLDSR